MPAHQADPVIRVLTTVVTVAYYLSWAALAAGLIMTMTGSWPSGATIDVQVGLPGHESVTTEWGVARLDDPRADLELPVRSLPWRVVGVRLGFGLLWGAIFLLTLHHLRRIFERVRDGAPFDAQNSVRLRWIGLLLIPLMLGQQLGPYLTSRALVRELHDPTLGVHIISRLDWDLTKLFFALTVIALAEIFRRGTELEDEQSLVV